MAKLDKSASSRSTSRDQNSGAMFDAVVENALRHFNDPTWLGQNSPLAAPYLLGAYRQNVVQANGSRELEQGAIVQQLLSDTIKHVCTDAKHGDRWRQIFDLRYLSQSPKSEVQIQDALALGRSAYHNHRNQAITALAQALIQTLKPAFHLETPEPISNLLGREPELATSLSALQKCQTIYILGPGGVGKTTLGIALAHQFAPDAVFWFTFRPGLNDRLSTLLFGLAHFLHSQGASHLWSQLIVDRGEVKSETLNLLHSDLMVLSDQNLVLCFDEVDLLRPTEVEAHAQLVPFLQSLSGLVPLVLIGQRAIIEADAHIELSGLPTFWVEQLLQQAQIYLSREEIMRLCVGTDGNPRLITLFVALTYAQQRAGAPTDEILAQMTQTLSMEFLLRRLWLHLNRDEMLLLELLVIFRHAVPRESWSGSTEIEALEQLIHWRLVQVDRQDGVTLFPAFKEAILGLLTLDERVVLHSQAAQIRLRFGQYTWAAYHFVESDDHQTAFALWDQYHEQEIDQGQAKVGYALLLTISKQRLNQEDSEKLEFRLVELRKLLGDYDQALEQIQDAFWHTPFLKAQVTRFAGDIHEARGNHLQAIRAYEEALDLTEKWLRESANLHRAVGYLYARTRDVEAAKREILRIRHDAANLEGVLLNLQGKEIEKIAKAYEEAIQLAKAANYPYGEANARINLGRLYGWQRNLNKAKEHLQQAIDYFALTGNQSKLASAKSNLAVAYCLAEQFLAAIEPAQKSLELFEELGEEFGRAVGIQILAEAYFGLGDLAQAEHFATRVVQEENIHTQPDGLRVLGEIKLQQGDLQTAGTFVQQSLTTAKETDNPKIQAYALRTLGEIYLAKENQDQAHSFFQQAIHIFTKSGLFEEVEKTVQVMPI